MEKILMNPATGSVAPESEWLADFASMTAEEWGGTTFESAGLVEVVANIPGQPGYDPNYGDWRDGQAMTEQAWQEALSDCFRTHKVSLDNGLTYMDADEAMPRIADRGLWYAVVEFMHDEIREAVCAEAEYNELGFLRRYLELAPYDLVIG